MKSHLYHERKTVFRKSKKKPSGESFYCDLCYFKTKKYAALHKHISTHKKVVNKFSSSLCRIDAEDKFMCNKCYFYTNKLKMWKKHIKKHKNSFIIEWYSSNRLHFNCRYCSHIETDFQTLLKHVQANHINTSDDFRMKGLEKLRKQLKDIQRSNFKKSISSFKSQGYPLDLLQEVNDVKNVPSFPKQKKNFLEDVSESSEYQVCSKSSDTDNFTCPKCKVITKLPVNQDVNTNEIPSCSCVECGLHFETNEILEQHRTITKHKQPSCMCKYKEEFQTKNMKPHVLIAGHEEEVYSCCTCKKKFVSERRLKIHLKSTGHEPTGNLATIKLEGKRKERCYFCGECNRSFRSNQDLKLHLVGSAHRNINHDCKCGNIFSTKISLEEHIVTTGHNRQVFICAECKKQFFYKGSLEQHIILTGHTNLNEGPKVFVCSVCNIGFSDKNLMDHHIKDTAHMQYSFKCSRSWCNSTFPTKNQLEQHKIGTRHNIKDFDSSKSQIKSIKLTPPECRKQHSVTVNGPANYTCQVCKIVFSTNNSLANHVITTGHVEIYQCPRCANDFLTEVSLDEHMRDNRCGAKKYSKSFNCTHCVRQFKTNESLQQHITAKGHIVPQLETKYVPKVSLKKLAMNNSTVMMPVRNDSNSKLKPKMVSAQVQQMQVDSFNQEDLFYCPRCTLKFESKLFLKQHIDISGHNYFCSVCESNFATERGLKKHIKSKMHQTEVQLQSVQSYSKQKIEKHSAHLLQKAIVNPLESAENSTEINSCSVCISMSKSKKGKKEKSTLLICETCKEEFETIISFVKHIFDLRHKRACNLCERHKGSMYSLLNKMKKATTCAVCKGVFSSNEVLLEHVEATGHGYLCEMCKAQFKTTASLETHMETFEHTKCTFCRVKFRTIKLLKKHCESSGHKF